MMRLITFLMLLCSVAESSKIKDFFQPMIDKFTAQESEKTMEEELVDEIMSKLEEDKIVVIPMTVTVVEVNAIASTVVVEVVNEMPAEEMTEETNKDMMEMIVDKVSSRLMEIGSKIADVSETVAEKTAEVAEIVTAIVDKILNAMAPTLPPTSYPTESPTLPPTSTPTSAPTYSPTSSPTSSPTFSPTSSPTAAPSPFPTASPTEAAMTFTDKTKLIIQVVVRVVNQINHFLAEEKRVIPDIDGEAISSIVADVVHKYSETVDLSSMSKEQIQDVVNKLSKLILEDYLGIPIEEDTEIVPENNPKAIINTITSIAKGIINRIIVPKTTPSPTTIETMAPTAVLATPSPTAATAAPTMSPETDVMINVAVEIIIEVNASIEITGEELDLGDEDLTIIVTDALIGLADEMDLGDLADEKLHGFVETMAQMIVKKYSKR